jgi:signal transduction histidine kinase
VRNVSIEQELKKEVYLRSLESSIGQILLAIIFIGISHEYLAVYRGFLILSFFCIGLGVIRFISSYKYKKSKEPSLIIEQVIEWSAMASGITWGVLFSHAYWELGLYQAPTISLYIIIAGIASGAASSLFSIGYVYYTFMFSTVMVPGILMTIKETVTEEKLFGLMLILFFAFLTSQARRNKSNLKTRIMHNKYLDEETNRIQNLFEIIPGVFCSFEKNGTVLSSNKAWSELSLKLNSAQENVYSLLNLKQIIFERSFDEKIVQSFETEFNDGNEKLSFVVYVKRASTPNTYIMFMVDTSELKKVQEEIKQKNAHLQHSARLIELGEMVGAIAHEINNPLTIVLGKVHTLKRLHSETEDEKTKGALEAIEKSSKRINGLVVGMKNLVRSSENDPLSIENFEPYIESIHFFAKNKAEMRKIDFEIIKETDDLTCYCRPSQVEQVLNNLITNAMDAIENRDEKWVKLYIRKEENYLTFEVTDSGHGIPKELENKIWNPFFTTKEIGKGTGLGLSISLTIAQENQGSLIYLKRNNHTSFELKLKKAA